MTKISPETSPDETKENWIEKINSPKVTVILLVIIGLLLAYVMTGKNEEPPKTLDRSITKKTEEIPQNIKETTIPSNSEDINEKTLKKEESLEKITEETSSWNLIWSTENSGSVIEGESEKLIVSWNALPVELQPVELPIELQPKEATTQSGSIAQYFEQYSWKDTPYYQSSVWYWFLIPKGTYYQGFWAKDGASHSVALMTGTGVTDWENSNTKLWFYKKSIPPELSVVAGNYYEDPSTWTMYLRVGSGSVKIQGDSSSPVVQSIIQSIKSE
jgi:hypothetical protein